MNTTEPPEKYGVVWSSREVEICQTGYVFDTPEAARDAGILGLEWFKETKGVDMREAVGTQVDWTADDNTEPTGFWVDTEQADSNRWFDKPGSVLQPWLTGLTMMQQSVLLAAIRGPDGIRKNHPAKMLLRWFRRCILYSAFDRKIFTNAFEPGGGSFTGPCPLATIEEAVNQYIATLDELPHHFQLHFMHAAQVLGYKHPDSHTRVFWNNFYLTLVQDAHLLPESMRQMDIRLGDCEVDWRAYEMVPAE